MQKCRRCGSLGNNLKQFGTKFYYCSEQCYEASYRLVTSSEELSIVIATWDKDILVEGDLAEKLIMLKNIPEKMINIYVKVLKMLGFENLEAPCNGDVSEIQNIMGNRLKSKEEQDLHMGFICDMDVTPGLSKNIQDLITKMLAIVVLGTIVIYAIYSRYEVVLECEKGVTRVRLTPKGKEVLESQK